MIRFRTKVTICGERRLDQASQDEGITRIPMVISPLIRESVRIMIKNEKMKG
jgi:hypothetical protein